MVMVCEHFGKCGGCKYLDFSYENQLKIKVKKVVEIFGKEPSEVVKSPKIYFYRNRMDYAVGKNYEVGLKERGKWYAYVDIENCLLQSEESNKIRNLFREFIKREKLEPYNIFSHKGLVRYLVIREGKFTGERMIHIILTREEEKIKNFLEEIKDLITSFYIGINEKIADVSISEKYSLLYGNKFLREKLSDNIYHILPNTFFQSNSYTAEILIKKVIEFLDIRSDDKIYDLYGGVGTFSIEIAKYCEVINVESDKDAKICFEESLKANNVKANFINEKVENLKSIDATKIVVDPPRSGMHKKAVELVDLSNAKRIIYVSCNPITQFRDIKMMKNYKLLDYILIDQFPFTNHIESIAILEKR